MSATIAQADLVPRTNHRTKDAPRIRLHHGEAVWVMAQLGFQGSASDSTFYEYIKSLRKLGIPFERIGYHRRGQANYSYWHLMELALALKLRVYHVVPDAILGEVIRHRKLLYRRFRQAYADRHSGIGTQVTFSASGHQPITSRGVFLDLQIDFSGGALTRFGPPIILSPDQALAAFADQDVAARALLPINLSLLAERLAAMALQAPEIRTGPKLPDRSDPSRSRSRTEPVE